MASSRISSSNEGRPAHSEQGPDSREGPQEARNLTVPGQRIAWDLAKYIAGEKTFEKTENFCMCFRKADNIQGRSARKWLRIALGCEFEGSLASETLHMSVSICLLACGPSSRMALAL